MVQIIPKFADNAIYLVCNVMMMVRWVILRSVITVQIELHYFTNQLPLVRFHVKIKLTNAQKLNVVIANIHA